MIGLETVKGCNASFKGQNFEHLRHETMKCLIFCAFLPFTILFNLKFTLWSGFCSQNKFCYCEKWNAVKAGTMLLRIFVMACHWLY